MQRKLRTLLPPLSLALVCGCMLLPQAHAQFTSTTPAPVTPSARQPDIFSRPENDPGFPQMARARRERYAQERFNRLKLGSDHLRELCAQLQTNLSSHGTPDDADRKIMAEIEKQTKALHNLMVQ